MEASRKERSLSGRGPGTEEGLAVRTRNGERRCPT